MAKNGKKTRAKKYSYNDRAKYHKNRFENFISKFRITKPNGSVAIDFNGLEKSQKSNPKIQYSSGFSEAVDDLQRGYEMPHAELKKKSVDFQNGYLAAQYSFDKAHNIKY